jgi:hypothetical protein
MFATLLYIQTKTLALSALLNSKNIKEKYILSP